MAQNGGTGLLQFYVDNVLQSQQTYISTDPMAVMDTHHYVLYLNAGVFNSAAADFVRVLGP